MSNPNQQNQNQQRPAASATTCVIGCKLPHGLTMELFARNADGKPVKSIGRYTVNGANSKRVWGGYALTEGVPTDFAKKWFEEKVGHPAVVNGSIFMAGDGRSAEARAKEGRHIETGLEFIDPLNQGTQKRFKISLDKDGEKAYRQQMAQNPLREHQIQE